MNKNLIKEVEEQMEIADQLYKDNVENINLDELLEASVAVKKAKAHMMGTVIEQYLKALIIWKGGTWKEMKKLSHSLLELYRVLDNEGKKILLDMFEMKHKKHKNSEVFGTRNYQSNANLDLFTAGNKFIQYISNGKYDGDYDFPEQLDEEEFDLSYFEALLQKVNVPSLRYSSSEYNLTNKDLIKLFNLARNMHVLSKIARGDKQQRRGR